MTAWRAGLQNDSWACSMLTAHGADVTCRCRSHVPPRDSSMPDAMTIMGTAPLTPSQTLQAHMSNLTGFEQSEILQYQQIYFWGLQMAHKHEGTPQVSDLNHGCASIDSHCIHTLQTRFLSTQLLHKMTCLFPSRHHPHPQKKL